MTNTTQHTTTATIVRYLEDAAETYGVDLDGAETVAEYRAAFARAGVDGSQVPGHGSHDPTISGWLAALEERGVDSLDSIVDNATVQRMMVEAGEHGDDRMVATCHRALAGDHVARAEVAQAIADARAMDDA